MRAPNSIAILVVVVIVLLVPPLPVIIPTILREAPQPCRVHRRHVVARFSQPCQANPLSSGGSGGGGGRGTRAPEAGRRRILTTTTTAVAYVRAYATTIVTTPRREITLVAHFALPTAITTAVALFVVLCLFFHAPLSFPQRRFACPCCPQRRRRRRCLVLPFFVLLLLLLLEAPAAGHGCLQRLLLPRPLSERLMVFELPLFRQPLLHLCLPRCLSDLPPPRRIRSHRRLSLRFLSL
jgi:hypothetical protein